MLWKQQEWKFHVKTALQVSLLFMIKGGEHTSFFFGLKSNKLADIAMLKMMQTYQYDDAGYLLIRRFYLVALWSNISVWIKQAFWTQLYDII